MQLFKFMVDESRASNLNKRSTPGHRNDMDRKMDKKHSKKQNTLRRCQCPHLHKGTFTH